MTSEMCDILAAKVKRIKKDWCMSNASVARKIQVSNTTMNRFINGDYGVLGEEKQNELHRLLIDFPA